MAFLAMFTGTLFWLVVFFCLMASAYVLFRDGFGYKGALEAAIFLGLMVVVGLPLHMVARRLSGRVMARTAEAAEGPGAPNTPDAPGRRRRRGRGRR